MSKTTSIRLTHRICNDLRIVLRKKSDEVLVTNRNEYVHYKKVAEQLDREKASVKGGVTVHMSYWSRSALLVLRELLFALLEDCTQVQIRRAVLKRIATIEDYAEVSAVERLGNIVQLKVAS